MGQTTNKSIIKATNAINKKVQDDELYQTVLKVSSDHREKTQKLIDEGCDD